MGGNIDIDIVEKITSEIRDGVYQSYLVSSTGLDPMIISKICEGLGTKGLIVRKEIIESGGRTYKINPTNKTDYEIMKGLISKYLAKEE